MSIDRIIAQSGTGTLVAGLTWRPVTGGKHSRKRLDEARAQLDATHYVVQSGAHAAAYGFFVPRPSEEGQRLPKGAASAAAVFASIVGTDHPNAALLLRLGDADRFYLVTLDDGMPTLDMVNDLHSVLEALGEEKRPIWSDQEELDGHALQEAVDLHWLTGHPPGKSARLLAAPVNILPALVITAVVVLAVGGWQAWSQHKKAQERKRAEQEAREADPLPKYLAALVASRSRMYSDRGDLQRLVGQLLAMPAKVVRKGSGSPAWQLMMVQCYAAERYCKATWQRQGGSFEELKAALPNMSLVLETKNGSAPSLDIAEMRFTPTWSRNLTSTPQLPQFDQAFVSGGSLFQLWKNAGMSVDVKGPDLWPKAAGVPSSFNTPHGVWRGEVTVSSVPGPFLAEVIKAAPAWMSWEYLKVELPSNSLAPASLVKFTMTANYYVASK
ncbi:type 4b pilus protein PilO2 [Pelomonas sp. APW6]|uniref:Type 4b pilus protein PilO2 n=1 Tax=Roseateles subflavus TaxID=3053353 RepID=A0ABT7LNC3_9BURK|nr:type 4b pilus protein PilO2 [Pelomonas sp. APW6]MDL5034355.1 type 4b pilus protein PilO2 [Pelomonas sp. APW6]